MTDTTLCPHGDHFDPDHHDEDECRTCRAAEDGPPDDDWIHGAYLRRADAGLPV